MRERAITLPFEELITAAANATAAGAPSRNVVVRRIAQFVSLCGCYVNSKEGNFRLLRSAADDACTATHTVLLLMTSILLEWRVDCFRCFPASCLS